MGRGPRSRTGRAAWRRRRVPALIAAACAAGAFAGCGSAGVMPARSGRLNVVAAENFWGSIAAQLGGDEVTVTSVITDPGSDPHSYEPTTADARVVAASQMTIVNGIGYDEWAGRLLSADASSARTVLDVGRVLGLRGGDNPHQWYSPPHVGRVIAQITHDYQVLRPADSEYFAQRRRDFEAAGLGRYRQLLAQIRHRYAGVPVGYSESVFQPLGEAAGLHLVTPESFAKAVADGTDATAQDIRAVERDASSRAIKVWVYNSQNRTPEVQRVNELAAAAHIPVVTVTETLAPASASFEQWQTAQLERLQAALAQATGR